MILDGSAFREDHISYYDWLIGRLK